jgi:hypothetical protein
VSEFTTLQLLFFDACSSGRWQSSLSSNISGMDYSRLNQTLHKTKVESREVQRERQRELAGAFSEAISVQCTTCEHHASLCPHSSTRWMDRDYVALSGTYHRKRRPIRLMHCETLNAKVSWYSCPGPSELVSRVEPASLHLVRNRCLVLRRCAAALTTGTRGCPLLCQPDE